MVSYDPGEHGLFSQVIYSDSLCFVVFPGHPLAGRKEAKITELGGETFIAHNVISPYRQTVLRAFQKHQVPLNMNVEMPTLETIKQAVQHKMGVAFLPRMTVREELQSGTLVEVGIKELRVERKIRLIYPNRRQLSHAAKAFLDLVKNAG